MPKTVLELTSMLNKNGTIPGRDVSLAVIAQALISILNELQQRK